MGLKPPFSWPHMLKKNWVINQIRHSKIGHFDTPPCRHAFVMVHPPPPPVGRNPKSLGMTPQRSKPKKT